MRCEKVQEQLPAYQGGALGWLAQRRLVAHLEQCEACRCELRALERTVALLRGAEGTRIPRDVSASVMERIRREPVPAPRARRARPLVLVPAALAAAAALVVQLTVNSTTPRVVELDATGAAYLEEYAQFRANQEIGDSTGIILLASELAETPE